MRELWVPGVEPQPSAHGVPPKYPGTGGRKGGRGQREGLKWSRTSHADERQRYQTRGDQSPQHPEGPRQISEANDPYWQDIADSHSIEGPEAQYPGMPAPEWRGRGAPGECLRDNS
ncbi:hypothetical protein NDU88_004392 [Pleurodeles waltl]|uniref:Uncharacterized protein n=1 Tax=Pleurodeles waltl TaxID=8319 RepID=A0AAV7W4W4_PLEWA|nr:hypothetical protein NDU88_004392 [Pleurodeles waltl]